MLLLSQVSVRQRTAQFLISVKILSLRCNKFTLLSSEPTLVRKREGIGGLLAFSWASTLAHFARFLLPAAPSILQHHSVDFMSCCLLSTDFSSAVSVSEDPQFD
ncbi:hypothetical protein ILYODFUR_017028 [Ilyodon furcidens]|uniref:Uncharacterized protein n=1 Tax=Ilyodon furcidens TaxID=33524 RepID=A0ABV0VFA3_9TELE